MLISKGRRLYRLASWWLLLCAAAFAFGEPLIIGAPAHAAPLPATPDLYRALTLTIALWLAFAGIITLAMERQLLTDESKCQAALCNAGLWLLAVVLLAFVQPNERALLAALVACLIYGASWWQLRFR